MEENRVVVVTGGSAGVGRAISRAFAADGWSVGVLARGEERLAATAREIQAAGMAACTVSTDVSDSDAVEAAATRVEQELGPIDVWINDAMTSVFAPFQDVKPEEFERVTDVTYHGAVNGTRAALARMVPRNQGVICQIGTALAYRGIPLQAAYCGAKHAIQGFTESVRCELMADDSAVRIGMLQLPAVNTPQFDWVLSRLPHRAQPVPPIFEPELIAAAAVRFAHEPRREMWLGWPTVRAILANRVVPGALDWYLSRNGLSSQQTDEPESPDRPSNLWEPVSGDWAAHGRFDERATASSPMMWMSRHRRDLMGAAASVLALAGAVVSFRNARA